VDSDSLLTLLDELSSFSAVGGAPPAHQAVVPSPSSTPRLSEDQIEQYVMDKSKELIDAGTNAVTELVNVVTTGQNPDEIAALSELMNATSKAIEVLNKSALISKKAKHDERLKRIEIQARKEMLQLQQETQQPTNMNVVVMSREDIMKKLFNTDQQTIDVEPLQLDDK
jgi:hypothetical protein